MRISILIDSSGTLVNGPGSNSFINYAALNGNANYSLFNNQVTLECMNSIIQQPSGIYVPDYTSVVKSGLTGSLVFEAFASAYVPYATDITPSDSIDISSKCILQWVGITQSLDITATDIDGCNYINILFDRN